MHSHSIPIYTSNSNFTSSSQVTYIVTDLNTLHNTFYPLPAIIRREVNSQNRFLKNHIFFRNHFLLFFLNPSPTFAGYYMAGRGHPKHFWKPSIFSLLPATIWQDCVDTQNHFSTFVDCNRSGLCGHLKTLLSHSSSDKPRQDNWAPWIQTTPTFTGYYTDDCGHRKIIFQLPVRVPTTTQPNSTQLNPTQLNSTQYNSTNSTQHNPKQFT